MQSSKQTIITGEIIFLVCAILTTNILMSMNRTSLEEVRSTGKEKLHTITVHNQLPLTSKAKVTVIEVQKNAQGESCGGTITDILPEKPMPFTKKITYKSVDFMLKIEEKKQYNQMIININTEIAYEDIYVRTKNEKIIVSNSTQKLITLYAINKKQKRENNK